MWYKFKNFTKPLSIIILMLAIIFLGGLIFTYFPKEALPPIVYRIAIDETWYPLQLYDKEQDITVFSEEIARAIAEKQHFSMETNTSWIRRSIHRSRQWRI